MALGLGNKNKTYVHQLPKVKCVYPPFPPLSLCQIIILKPRDRNKTTDKLYFVHSGSGERTYTKLNKNQITTPPSPVAAPCPRYCQFQPFQALFTRISCPSNICNNNHFISVIQTLSHCPYMRISQLEIIRFKEALELSICIVHTHILGHNSSP